MQTQQFFQKSNIPSSDHDEELIACDTVGDGDCAFHAIFGEWDSKRRKYFCENAGKKREYISQAIIKAKPGSNIYLKVIEEIKSLVQTKDSETVGEKIQRIRDSYFEYVKSCNDQLDDKWKEFESYLTENCKELVSFVNETGKQKKAFREKFSYCLECNQYKLQVEGFIDKHPISKTLYEEYNQLAENDTFDWKQIEEPAVIAEYAKERMGNEGIYLSHIEVEIIAYASKLAVEFHNNSTINVFNSKQKKKVAIRFNGINHFEKMVSRKEAKAHLSSNKEEDSEEEQDSYIQSINNEKNDSLLENIPEKLKCGICEEILLGTVVRGKYKEQCHQESNNAIDTNRNFHKQCLTHAQKEDKHLKIKELRSSELEYLKEALEKYVKPVAEEYEDYAKTIIQLSALSQTLVVQQKLSIKSMDFRNTLKNLKLVEINGELAFALRYVDINNLKQDYLFLTQKVWSEAKLEVSKAYAVSTLVPASLFGAAGGGVTALITYIGEGAVALGPVGIVVGVVGLAAAIINFFGKYKERQFVIALKNAIELFDDGIRGNSDKFKEVEKILACEFGEENEGRYLVTRVVRWPKITYDEFAFAHLLRAENAVKLGDEKAFQEFEWAYNDAEDEQLKIMSLIGMIKLLSPLSAGPVPVRNKKKLSKEEKQKLLKQYIETLNKNYKAIIKKYFDEVVAIYQKLFSAIKANKQITNEFLCSQDIVQLLHCQEIYLFRYYEPHGKVCEVLLHFIQGLLFLLYKEHDLQIPEKVEAKIKHSEQNHDKKKDNLSHVNKSAYLLARIKFEESWVCLKETELNKQIGANNDAGRILLEIKDFIFRFFKRCLERKIFTDKEAADLIEQLDDNTKFEYLDEINMLKNKIIVLQNENKKLRTYLEKEMSIDNDNEMQQNELLNSFKESIDLNKQLGEETEKYKEALGQLVKEKIKLQQQCASLDKENAALREEIKEKQTDSKISILRKFKK